MATKTKKAAQSKTRSPNYPYIGLATAITRTRALYDKDYRNRMSKDVVAKHLGYGGLNGISLSVISALGKYGLVESVDDDLQVSQDAVTIFVDPENSPERAEALRRAALKPALFAELFKRFGGQSPSAENLLAHLQKNGFTPNAAAIAAKSFRETIQLISGQAPDARANDGTASEGNGMQPEPQKTPSPLIKTAIGERELTTGLLSKSASFRLIVSGAVGVKEIDRLIEKLKLDKEILADLDADNDQG